MNIPEGFTPRVNSNEQPPETYDKTVETITPYNLDWGYAPGRGPANQLSWKVPDGPVRIIAYKILP